MKTAAPKVNKGPARYGAQRQLYEKNRKIILASQDVCAICGKPVDKDLKYPHPLSACIDHIIPLDKGGDSSIKNLQLAHLTCNRLKSNKLFKDESKKTVAEQNDGLVSNRNLPHTFDWLHYKA